MTARRSLQVTQVFAVDQTSQIYTSFPGNLGMTFVIHHIESVPAHDYG